MYKNIIFDCGNVLLHFDFTAKLLEIAGDEQTTKALLPLIHDRDIWQRYDMGIINGEQAQKEAFAKFPSHLHPYIHQFFDRWPETFSPEPGMLPLIKQLKAAGYNLYLLSNFPDRFYELEKQYEVFRYLDGMIISCDHQLAKPDAKIYRLLLDTYHLAAEECIFIDDMPENATGACNVGITGHTFTGAAELTDFLQSLHIL